MSVSSVSTPQAVRSAVGAELRSLPLKDMEPSMLYVAALHEGADLQVDVARLGAAMELAAFLHRDDTRSNRKSLPVDTYVTHPFRIVLRLIRYGCSDDDVLCAAALHDTVEDHPGELVALLGDAPTSRPTAEEQQAALDLLGQAFGGDVARIVAAVTNPPAPAGLTESERHQVYCEHVAEVIADPQVLLVKLADFVDNAGSVRYLDDEVRRARLARKYAPLVPAFRAALASHGPALPVDPDGLGRIERHLDGMDLGEA